MGDNLLMDQGVAKLDFSITVKGGGVYVKGAVNQLGISGVLPTILEALEQTELSMCNNKVEAKSLIASALMVYIEDQLGLDPKKLFK